MRSEKSLHIKTRYFINRLFPEGVVNVSDVEIIVMLAARANIRLFVKCIPTLYILAKCFVVFFLFAVRDPFPVFSAGVFFRPAGKRLPSLCAVRHVNAHGELHQPAWQCSDGSSAVTSLHFLTPLLNL